MTSVFLCLFILMFLCLTRADLFIKTAVHDRFLFWLLTIVMSLFSYMVRERGLLREAHGHELINSII